MKIFVIVLLLSILCLSKAQQPQVDAVQGLIQRWFPAYVSSFQLEIIPNVSGDVFEIESNGSYIVLRGNTGVSIASALNYYLKYFCNVHISWTGNQLNLPTTLPQVPSLIRMPIVMDYRYYMNVCTFGYSTVWWNWTRWEWEIDWMALNGINLPLAFNGQEMIWQIVFLKLGLSESDLANFFTGPAFLPWQRMGNVNGWGGPLPDSWIVLRAQLQVQILTQMRSFGMKPVLPAFAGHVPQALKEHYPSASITQLAGWNSYFNGTFLLDPMDPLFAQISNLFITTQTEFYSTDHYYNTDLFNELVPPSNNVTYLAEVSSEVYKNLVQADSSAVWVMQGWFLVNDPAFWQPPQAEAFLSSIPQANLLMLDLWADVDPIWNQTQKFYGHNFVWCMLHNFGGRTGIYGSIETIASQPAYTYAQASNMVGMGLTPEAIETNVILYDLMMEMPWRIGMDKSGLIDQLDAWVTNFTVRRYGQVSAHAASAWYTLQNTLLNVHQRQEGTAVSLVTLRPSLVLNSVAIPSYDLAVVPQILEQFIAAANHSSSPSLATQETFQHDVASVTRQMITNAVFVLYQNMTVAFNNKDTSAFTQWSGMLLDAINDTDVVVSTQSMWLVGNWIQSARSWGTTPEEQALYEFNARNQLTLWGPAESSLHDYAGKLWGGLVKDFYYPRWALFVSSLSDSLTSGNPFDYDAFVTAVETQEYAWNVATNVYPTAPSGDALALAQPMLTKYQSIFN